MPEQSHHGRTAADDSDDCLLREFTGLWAAADKLWEQNSEKPAFHGYVSSNYQAVYDHLNQLRGRVLTVLEWGSGLGIVTIMASRMGFEAYGIESESELVEYSEQFARDYGPDAQFAQGSFIPDEFEWDPSGGDEVVRTDIDSPAAYDAFDMELRDFDLIYAYPWPDERIMFCNIIRQFGRKDAMLLAFDVREGLELLSFNTG